MFWLAIGVGTPIFLSLQKSLDLHPSVGAIPMAVGVSYLICYAIETRKPKT
ncbi:MAG: hypothetical protein HY735_37210 [Verrucomicrobia bacterium]|nr:hypothetical protein [Verrucomicrobiota bacterium]